MPDVPKSPPAPPSRSVRAVALFEVLKGLLALLVAAGLTLVHRDVQALALTLVEHTHLNPAARYPGILLQAASHLQNSHVLLLAAGVLVYALLRLAEAYGLYADKAWAQVLAAVSGGVYVPAELLGLWHRPSWLGLGLLLANLAVVAVMVRALRHRRAQAHLQRPTREQTPG